MFRNAMRAVLLLATVPAIAAENVVVVLDASGSMGGKVDGRSKIEIAREAIDGMIASWKPENAIGLVAYGHRRKGDCADIETVIPLGALDAGRFMATVNALEPKGMTPLSQAVIDAATALRSEERKATVILVSDGEETCKLDPCAVGAELERSGVDFTAHVIGFDVNDPSHQAQLRCLAENTGGRYFNARDARELDRAIRGAVGASTQPPPPPATASVKPLGPATITQPLDVQWQGPADDGDFVTVVLPQAPDGHFTTYALVPDGKDSGTLRFDMPATAGTYELRYVSPRREPQVLARASLPIGDLEATIDAPETAIAGTTIRVTARGPVSDSHWIGFAESGSGTGAYVSGHYARPTADRKPIDLTVPARPGAYELRYVLNESERVVYSRPIRITQAEVMVDGPAEVMAGDRVTIRASGPVDASHWIGFAPAGSDAPAYVNGGYARPEAASGSVTVHAPFEPGRYEYRYVLFEGEEIAASRPVTVTAAQATLQPPSSAAADASIRVAFAGPRAESNWIGFVPPGGDGGEFEDWTYVPASGDAVDLRTPAQAGDWDVVFVVDGKVIARERVRIGG